MMSTSSAVELGDLAISWDGTASDLEIIDGDLASDLGMVTAVLISLFSDRRAADDDVPPSGDVDDRRGWWADEFLVDEGDRLGSRMWLLDRGTATAETGRRAETYVREALAWMVEDRVAKAIGVVVTVERTTMLIAVTIDRPGREPLALRFAHVWR